LFFRESPKEFAVFYREEFGCNVLEKTACIELMPGP
jgi:hypothetical protein